MDNFNVLNLESLSEEEITSRIAELFKKASDGSALDETPAGLMYYADLLARLQPYYIEMDVRLNQEYQTIKHENDTEEDILTYQLRRDWPLEHPNEKAPSIDYFKGKAKKQLKDGRNREFEVYAKMKRFKENKDALVDEINVLKKKLDSFKYD